MDLLRLDQHVDPDRIARALAPWLDDLEARLDDADENRLWREWVEFADGRWQEPVFRPRRARPSPPGISWPALGIEAAITDPERMLLHQLKGCSDLLAGGGGGLLCVRANYGTGILPSLFGVAVVKMAEAMDTLPGTLPLDRAGLERLVADGPPALTSGLWPLVRAVGAAFQAITSGRPRLRRHLHLYHPDLQGPMDVLEMAWGSACFTGFVEEPGFTHAALEVITSTFLACLRDWDAVIGDPHPGHTVHWGMLHRGHVMLRDDSAMNLSPRMFATFIAPYDRRILAAVGGGAIHACGKVDHFLAQATALPGVTAFNFGQPQLNDPQRIAAGTIDRGVNLIGIGHQAWLTLAAAGIEGRGWVHIAT